MKEGTFPSFSILLEGKVIELLGISVYLSGDPQEYENYIKKMSACGFQSIFTSLHIPEDDPTLYSERLRKLGAIASENRMELMADISPKSLSHLGFTWENAEGLLGWGLSGIRMDYGVDEAVIAKLSQKMKIALNASTLTAQSLQRMKSSGLRTESVEAWHNFYPRPETGLGMGDFIRTNEWLKAEGLSVMAFIPGDGELRGPLFKGLPTLERHRFASPFSAYLDLIQMGCVDKVLVGDVQLSDSTLEQFQEYKKDVLLMRAVPAVDAEDPWKKAVETAHTNRQDAARDCLRSVESRQYASANGIPAAPSGTGPRPIGSITIDNERYGRYQGEIQITKRDLPADEKVNVLGRVVPEDISILSCIGGGGRYKIKWVQDDCSAE